MPTQPDRLRSPGRRRVRLEGERFGYLVVVRFGGQHRKAGGRYVNLWLCRCERCGREDLVSIRESRLRSGETRSCGCLRNVLSGVRGEIGIRASKKAHIERKLAKRREERACWEGFRGLLAELMDRKTVPWRLMYQRWPGTRLAFEELMHRTAARVPTEDEALVLAQMLNLRGAEKDLFLRTAAEARKAIVEYRKGKSATAVV